MSAVLSAEPFHHLARWEPKLANWGRYVAPDLRQLGYALPHYVILHDEPADDAIEPIDVGCGKRMEAAIRTLRRDYPVQVRLVTSRYVRRMSTWEQLGQELQRHDRGMYLAWIRTWGGRGIAAKALIDRFCERLDAAYSSA